MLTVKCQVPTSEWAGNAKVGNYHFIINIIKIGLGKHHPLIIISEVIFLRNRRLAWSSASP